MARLPGSIPWADRDANRVVFRQPDGAGEIDPPIGWEDLFEMVHEIRMADVDVGWFVHPSERRSPGASVPRFLDGVGACAALGSDGGGAWLVVAEIDGVDGLWHLPAGSIVDGVFRSPPGTTPALVAGSPHELVEVMLEHARTAGRDA